MVYKCTYTHTHTEQHFHVPAVTGLGPCFPTRTLAQVSWFSAACDTALPTHVVLTSRHGHSVRLGFPCPEEEAGAGDITVYNPLPPQTPRWLCNFPATDSGYGDASLREWHVWLLSLTYRSFVLGHHGPGLG